MPHYIAPGRHAFMDVAVADSGTRAALAAHPSSATHAGVAADEQRAGRKVAKYGHICSSIGSCFRAGVVERFGACCDDMVGFVREVAGVRDRDALTDDYLCFFYELSPHLLGLPAGLCCCYWGCVHVG